jgi:hypothetical protein
MSFDFAVICLYYIVVADHSTPLSFELKPRKQFHLPFI